MYKPIKLFSVVHIKYQLFIMFSLYIIDGAWNFLLLLSFRDYCII